MEFVLVLGLVIAVMAFLFSAVWAKLDAANPSTTAPPDGGPNLATDGGFDLEVVGESYRQHALDRIAGPKTPKSKAMIVTAVLEREPGNRHDPNAIKVSINGQHVGYLSREDAVLMGRDWSRIARHAATLRCRAKIVGGWDDGEDDEGDYGVLLDIARPVRLA